MDKQDYQLSNFDSGKKCNEGLDCTDLKPCEDVSKHESLDKKRKLNGTESITDGSITKKKVCVEQSNNAVYNINCLPKEILIKIFRKLSHNELGHIARVSKKWNELTRCPLLWIKVDVQFRWRHGSQNEVVTIFTQSLTSCLTHLKLDFQFFYHLEWEDRLKFEELCISLRNKCPSLKALILQGAHFSVSLQSVIDLCRLHFQNLEVLSLSYSDFTNCSMKANYGDFSKIKILDFFCNQRIGNSTMLTVAKLPSLKKLSLVHTEASNNWFLNDTSFLENLEILNLQWADVNSRTFQTLKNCALKLTELYLCEANLRDHDFRFENSAFPALKTICLSGCHRVTSEGIVSLVKSCPFLENVYVNRKLAVSYADHRYVAVNWCRLQIVKITVLCQHFIKDYLYEE